MPPSPSAGAGPPPYCRQSSTDSSVTIAVESDHKSIRDSMDKDTTDTPGAADAARDTPPSSPLTRASALAVPSAAASDESPTPETSKPAGVPRSPSRSSSGKHPSQTTDAAAAATTTSSSDPEAQREPDIYDKFSPRRKHTIVAMASLAAFIGPIASSAFLPSIQVMAEDMHTTAAMINYTVAIFIVSIGVAPLVWSPLSGFYGRRPIFLMSLPIMTVASVGVALSKNIGQIIGTRILQGIGCSAVLSVGAGTVGDIYRPTERANAMAWFYSGILLGPALAPVLAGIFTEYTSITWRATQYFLCGLSGAVVLLIFFFMPETSHPVLPHEQAKKESGKKFVIYVFNPLTSLGLLQYMNIVIMTVASSCLMLQLYCIMVPLGVVFQERYHITNSAIAGTLYLSMGAGTLIGSRIGGPLADRIVRQYIEKRGYRRPEDRLRASLWGSGLITPVSGLVYGWLLYANKGGLAPPLIMLVIYGVGMQLSLTPVNTYLVDSTQKRSAEALAVNNFWRYLFAAAGSAFVIPMKDAIGLGWTMTVASGFAWAAFGCIVWTMRCGEGWRNAAKDRIARRQGSTENVVQVTDDTPPPPVDEKEQALAYTSTTEDIKASPSHHAPHMRPSSPIGIGIAAHDDDAVFLEEDEEVVAEMEPSTPKDHEHKLLGKLRHFRDTHRHARRQSAASATSDHDHGEAEHGEPTRLVSVPRRARAGTRTHCGSTSGSQGTGAGDAGGLTRSRSRHGSSATLPSVGDVLQRTVSLSGASFHGG